MASNQTVPLTSSLRKAYFKASKITRDSYKTWLRTETDDIEVKLTKAIGTGVFAKTSFSYYVILLGSKCLNKDEPDVEKIIEELYRSNLTKVNHGIFAEIQGESRTDAERALRNPVNKVKVATQLAEIFNDDPSLWNKIRLEWMFTDSSASRTSSTGQFIPDILVYDCSFLISEYIKHGSGVGLSLKDYIDLTSILFNYCDPVPSLGRNIDQQRIFAQANTFTKDTLAHKLVSPPDLAQPIPRGAICGCNADHVCIINEIMYTFDWVNHELVNRKPKEFRTWIHYCDYPGDDHTIHYLTQKDREDLRKYIQESQKYFCVGEKIRYGGGGRSRGGDTSGSGAGGSGAGGSTGGSRVVDNEGFEMITRRKGKGKK
ncbi:hypothetical protein POM88_052826 [Heracleum sosnowskyi]|uniref:Uncharacterized protein n=1 Tax=Heracleum sosnowskyi TaxID=360622 RepID=A0AAD8GR15_9APIA|nr:hypothetical protein POM88_052826 [Heracleum sosnowskyi]